MASQNDEARTETTVETDGPKLDKAAYHGIAGQAKAGPKPRKLFDGAGLYLLVNLAGGKCYRLGNPETAS
ncbi:MAG: hypothetical protein ACLQU2_02480 [Candidatus Binataceae bacterium]